MVLLVATCAAVGFDWVEYTSADFISVSVVPDTCTTPVDLMFLLDSSGSIEIPSLGGEIGYFNDKVLSFVRQVIPFFSIGAGNNESQIGVATFSTNATMHAALNAFSDASDLDTAVAEIPYDARGTYTSRGLHLVRTEMMNATNGLRPLEAGISRVLIVVTDGVSHDGYEPGPNASLIEDENVNIFAMGVGNGVDRFQLADTASSDDNVYMIKSFTRVMDIVAAISSKACDAPAVLTPGKRTMTTVADCDFKYFRPACPAVPGSSLQITVTAITGSVEVYVSLSSSHPGPFAFDYKDASDDVEKIILVDRQDGLSGLVTVAVKGTSPGVNNFTLDVWSDIFRGETLHVDTWMEDTPPLTQIYAPPLTFTGSASVTTTAAATTTAAGREVSTNVRLVDGASDNEGRVEVLISGVWGTVCDDDWSTGDARVVCRELGFSGGARRTGATFGQGADSSPIHFDDVDCDGDEDTLHDCARRNGDPSHNCEHHEDAGVVCDAPVATTTAASSDALPTAYRYSIVSGNDDGAFTIDPATGIVSIGENGLDYETTELHNLRIRGVNLQSTCLSGFMDMRISVGDVNDNEPILVGGVSSDGTTVGLPMNLLLNEATPPGSLVLRIRAVDPDGMLSYQLVEHSGGRRRQSSTFRINAQTGAIYTRTTLDFETQSFYSMSVTITDGLTSVVGNVSATLSPFPCAAGSFSVAGTGTFPCSSNDACSATEYEAEPPTANSNRVCRALTAPCALGDTYETAAATATSDRECTEQPSCGQADGAWGSWTPQFESLVATLTSARECTEVSDCTSNEYETAGPTTTTDRQCATLATCGVTGWLDGYAVGTYEARAPTSNTDRLCRSFSECSAAEYQSVAPTSTSDRTCAERTECDAEAEYESAAPTTSSNRVCTPISSCVSGEYESAGPTESADRTCAPTTVCAGTQYQTVAPTATTDRSCNGLTECDVGTTYQTTAPTATSDRVCDAVSDCTEGFFETQAPAAASDRVCTAHTECGGRLEVVGPTATTDRSCADLTECDVGTTYQTTAPTATSDRVCDDVSDCADDFFEIQPPSLLSDRVCAVHSECDANTEYETAAGTATSDRTCAAVTRCTSGQYQTVAPTATTDRSCNALAVCVIGTTYQATAPTTTSDRVCDAVSDCAEGSYETQPPNRLSDRVCATHTECDAATEWQIVAGTATSDRACRPHDVCDGVSSYETVAPTATSPRGCDRIMPCRSDEFEATAPTATSNRACNATSECTALLQFQIVAASATADRSCGDVTACDATSEYQVFAATATSDRGCEPVTECATGSSFQTRAPTIISDRVCANVLECSEGEFEIAAPTLVTNRRCASVTPCPADQYQTAPETASSNRVCSAHTECDATAEYETMAGTATSDRVCSALGDSCAPGQFETVAPTATTDRSCVDLVDCDAGTAYQSTAPTATSDRECRDLYDCKSSEYESQPPTATSDRVCRRITTRCGSDQFVSQAATNISNIVCTPFTECLEGLVLTLPTPTSDRVCGDSDSDQSGASSDDVGQSASMMMAILAAVCMALVLAGMVVRYQKTPLIEDADLAALFDEDGLNPMYGQDETGAAPRSAIALVAAAAVDPAALTQRGDRLWAEFRRCTAFDHMYFGNPLMSLGDEALEDVYALLAITCPPREFFDTLRTVGDRFVGQAVGRVTSNDDILDDVVDYILRAMPDVLLERGVDMAAVLDKASNQGIEADDEDIYETFYTMIDDYVPDDNSYLAAGDSGRGLMHDAALRELHQVDPIYYEPEDELDYEPVVGYALANVDEEPLYDHGEGGGGNTYDMGHAGNAIYDMGKSGNAIYDMGEATYGVGNPTQAGADGGDVIYGLADNDEDGIYGLANHADSPSRTPSGQPIYGMAASGDVAGSPIYGMASPSVEGEGEGGEVYDNRDNVQVDVQGVVYDNRNSLALEVGQDGEAIYGFADSIGAPADGLRDGAFDASGLPATAHGVIYDNNQPAEVAAIAQRRAASIRAANAPIDAVEQLRRASISSATSTTIDDVYGGVESVTIRSPIGEDEPVRLSSGGNRATVYSEAPSIGLVTPQMQVDFDEMEADGVGVDPDDDGEGGVDGYLEMQI